MQSMPTQPSKFDAIFFDLDGTLVDSVADIAASANHVRATMGKSPLPVPTVRSYVGDGIHSLFQRVLETKDPTTIEQAISLWRPHYIEHCLDQTILYSGIADLLIQLTALKIPMAVVTNKPVSPSEKILAGLSVRNHFASVVGGDTISERKPNPAPFLLALKQLNLTSRRILVVGDASNDIEGARNAGMTSCGVLWGIGHPDAIRKLNPDHIVSHPAEILSVLGM